MRFPIEVLFIAGVVSGAAITPSARSESNSQDAATHVHAEVSHGGPFQWFKNIAVEIKRELEAPSKIVKKATRPTVVAVSRTLVVTPTLKTTTVKSTSTAKATATTANSAIATGRAAFAHYMVGTMTQAEANTDVQQAKALGLDAFALNVASTDSWSTTSLSYMFAAANTYGFKLFFSFDMTYFSSPSGFIPILQTYYNNAAYYKYNSLPYVSTFGGGTLTFGYSSVNAGWQATYRDALTAKGISTYFVPDFSDSGIAGSSIYSTFPVVDGLFNWEGSWPYASQGKVAVSSSGDQSYLTAAKSASKAFIMGISALQFKHLSYGNYYRRGGVDLAIRVGQILSLSPPMVEIQTWNDAGESHYIGPIFSEAIAGSGISTYTDGYDHSGWQILMKAFISAYHAGATAVSGVVPLSGSVSGVFWHSTLLSTASCSGDSLGKPSGSENIDDNIEVAVMVAAGVSGVKVNVYSGGVLKGTFSTVTGLNYYDVTGLVTGYVNVQVVNSAGTVLIQGTGLKSVVADSSVCNYNPQVVGLA